MRVALTLGLVSAIALTQPLDAQGRGRGKNGDGVPPGHLPPAGQCRVWIDGVPPGRQPAPTDCATAERNRPANGRVIYGSRRDDRDDRRDRRDRRDDDRYEGRDRDRDRDHDRDRDRDRDRDGRYEDRRDSGRTGGVWGGQAPRRDGSGTQQGCTDKNKDGRCDALGTVARTAGVNLPATMPEMISTVALRKRDRTAAQTRWLGTSAVRATYVDRDGNRVPERIVWSDASGQVVQKWIDGNRDGRADYVEVWRSGRLVATRR